MVDFAESAKNLFPDLRVLNETFTVSAHGGFRHHGAAGTEEARDYAEFKVGRMLESVEATPAPGGCCTSHPHPAFRLSVR